MTSHLSCRFIFTFWLDFAPAPCKMNICTSNKFLNTCHSPVHSYRCIINSCSSRCVVVVHPCICKMFAQIISVQTFFQNERKEKVKLLLSIICVFLSSALFFWAWGIRLANSIQFHWCIIMDARCIMHWNQYSASACFSVNTHRSLRPLKRFLSQVINTKPCLLLFMSELLQQNAGAFLCLWERWALCMICWLSSDWERKKKTTTAWKEGSSGVKTLGNFMQTTALLCWIWIEPLTNKGCGA